MKERFLKARTARWAILGLVILSLGIGATWTRLQVRTSDNLVLVVMDPLAKPLSCACVKGYAQRDYDLLGKYLGERIGRKVRVLYAEDLKKALRQAGTAPVMLVIGKESVVRMDAEEAGLKLQPRFQLTDKDGRTDLTGLFAVKAGDPARSLADLKGRRILFGQKDSDEKHAAAMAALAQAGVRVPEKPETRPGCSDAAMDVQESKEDPPPACVISSYALPLLEGCGNIEKGSLRVIGQTALVPFITAFINSSLRAEEQDELQRGLSSVSRDETVLAALESRDGFAEWLHTSNEEWPGWRGMNRDALVQTLPDRLPSTPKFVWKRQLPGTGLGGIAVAEGRIVFSGRDLGDAKDMFSCLDARDGTPIWERTYPATGQLDYGESPRATPLLHLGNAYLLGAFGDLGCVRLADGKMLWEVNLLRKFGAERPKWGFAASPLIVDDKLIVNPGATNAALVALEPGSGKVVWSAPGAPAAYASFIVGIFGGRKQIVGYDSFSLGGWDPATGRRLWRLVPPNPGDFNVPTPLAWQGKLIVATENNGTRIYDFNRDGTIIAKPSAVCSRLAPDVNTPVIVGRRLFGCSSEFYCLDVSKGLEPIWSRTEDALGDFVTLIASKERVLLTTYRGELVLVSATARDYQVLSRLRVFGEDAEVFSHPALVDGRLYIRDNVSICCLELSSPSSGPSPSTVAVRAE